jgi:hypothetical protein
MGSALLFSMYLMLGGGKTSCLLSIFPWTQMGYLLEYLGEIALFLKPHQGGNLYEGKRSVE